MAEADEDDVKGYRWESGYEKTWELGALDDHDNKGHESAHIAEYIEKAKQKRLAEKTERNRLGLMRQLFILMDCSKAMSVPDLKPTRMLCSIKWLKSFAEEYVSANPISQMGIIALKGKRAEKISDLTGSFKQHTQALESLRNLTLQHEISLQNGLDMALTTLRYTPMHISREILIVMSALSTCDPGDLEKTIDVLVEEGIRVSVISLSAEVYVCRKLTERTNGSCCAVLNDVHFRDQLMSHLDPPAATERHCNALVKMGFPYGHSSEGKHAALSMCMCHVGHQDNASKLTAGGYHCPQCFSKYCQLPIECLVCELMLVTAPHLARSYHHLFPVARFTEVPYNGQVADCFGCQKVLSMSSDRHIYRCELCSQYYCICCDVFIHETLHSCVGCNTIRDVAQKIFLNTAQLSDRHNNIGYNTHINNRYRATTPIVKMSKRKK